MGVFIGIFGALLALLGVFAFIAAAMPTFGSRSNSDATTGFFMGAAMFVAGIAMIFYGGYLL